MRAFVPLAACLLLLGAGSPALSGGSEDRIGASLALVHDGRFDEADDLLAGAAAGDPETAFFQAFVVYWRLLYDDENQGLRAELEKRLDHTLALTEGAGGAPPADPRSGLYSGSAHLLLAELRASQKKVFAAAGEARRAKRILEQAVQTDETAADSSFALGTYNYMADRLPAFVKGIRALLFLPGGDRKEGLAQIERAASEGRRFRIEARILLSTIYSSRQERLYAEARKQAKLALDTGPGCVAALFAAGRIELSLHDPERALELLGKAADRAAGNPRTDRAVVSGIELQRARAEFALLRPDLSLARVRRIRPASEGIAKDASRLQDASTALTGSSPWARALPSLEKMGQTGAHAAAVADLVKLAEQYPSDPVAALLAGRALLLDSRAEEAMPLLLRAAHSASTPRPWQGIAKLLAGEAADLLGRRPQALALYREASDAPSFLGRDAALLYQRAPFRGES